MAIQSEQLAQITARAGVGRAGTMRANCAPKAYELKTGARAGEILWDRPVDRDGNPEPTAQTVQTGRE